MSRFRVILAAILVAFGATAASAETLLMPPRDFKSGTAEVVWGITTQANNTPYVLDYGDGSAQQTGNVVDRSYIAFTHTYALANTYTVQLCVGVGASIPGCTGELASVAVQVFNPAVLSPENLRSLNVNRAIQDGLRYLWTSQSARTTFDTTIETSWGNFAGPFTALVVLAYENHGYRLPNNNNVPTGIYAKYAVRRGFNYILNRMTTLAINVTPQGDDPCVSVPAPACSALSLQTTGDPGYENAIGILPFAGSGALARVNTEATAANTVNKTYGEILQRMVNATTWGQNDSNAGGARGGWTYGFNGGASDGSTDGWDMLAILDAMAAGANVPNFVKTEWSGAANALAMGLNNDGSFDYNNDNSRTNANAVNVAKTGVGVQGMFYAGRPSGDADVQNAIKYISDRWNEQNPVSLGTTQSFVCGNGKFNKGCAYAMFNVFKGMRLYGVATLPGVTRAAGPGAIPAGDWYADYVDYLLANQTNPQTTAGGNWSDLYFSSQTTNEPAEAAIAELILSPVALVAPDPERFGTVGLQHGGPPLSTAPDSNLVNTPHTVTAKAESGGANPSPIPGVTMSFRVQGRNNVTNATSGACNPVNCISGADGIVTYTYTDAGAANAPGVDNIQAFIGAVGGAPASNVVVKNWVLAGSIRCDADGNGTVQQADLVIINGAMGQNVSGPADARDGNGDGFINIADVRFCQRRLGATTNP